MQIKLLPSSFTVLLICIPFLGFTQQPGPVTNYTRVIRDSGVYNRGLQEINRIKDLSLNIVPIERIIKARTIRDQLLRAPVANQLGLGKARPAGAKTASANAAAANPSTANSATTVQWIERGPTNVGGRTRALIFDLNDKANGYKKVFAGGVGGGIWYTNDITATTITWNKISDFFDNIAISCMVQNPVNPLEIYAGTGEGFGVMTMGLGVWRSADGGATWTHLSATSSFSYITSMLVDRNSNVYFSALNSGIQRSADGGQTWTQILGAPVQGTSADGEDLELAANGDIYAALGDASDGQIFLSDATVNAANTGNVNTWKNITPDVNGILNSGVSSWQRIKLGCAPGDANTVYALFETSNQCVTSIERYSKSAATWSVKTVPTASFSNKQAWYAIAVGVDPNDANTLYAGSLLPYKSSDGGMTWARASQSVHVDNHTYTYAPGSSSRILMGTDGGVSYSSTANMVAGSAIFLDENNGYNVTQFYSVALHPTSLNYALAGAQDNGTQQFTTTGLNATSLASDGDGALTFIDQLTPNIQITSYIYNDRFISTDNGVTFNEVSFNTKGGFINPTDYDSRQKTLYSANTGGTYFRWNNVASASAKDGIAISVAGFQASQVTNVRVSPLTNNRVYFGLNSGNVVIVDNANGTGNTASIILTPNAVSNSIGASVSGIAIDLASENHILVSYYNYGTGSIYESHNALASVPVWTLVEGNLPDMPVRDIMFYPGDSTRSIIATQLGVWSTNLLNGASTTWLPTNSGLANAQVDQLAYRNSDRTLAAATFGRGLFTTTLPVSGNQKSIPVPVITAGGPTTLQTGGSVVLSTLAMTGYTNQWVNNGIDIPGATSTTYTATASGVYTFKLIQNGAFQQSNSITVNVIFSLAPTNFTLTNTSSSCIGSANGSVKINAALHMGYSAAITFNGVVSNYPFTDSLLVSSLGVGAYNICISVPLQSGYQQCFTAVITQPLDLTLYTAVDKLAKTVTLSLGGAEVYSINLNGVVTTTKNASLALDLRVGKNTLTVSTPKLCQGTLSREIVLAPTELVYPNPFINLITVDLGAIAPKNSGIIVYDINGKKVFSSAYSNQSGLIQLNLSQLGAGEYILKHTTDTNVTDTKIIKK